MRSMRRWKSPQTEALFALATSRGILRGISPEHFHSPIRKLIPCASGSVAFRSLGLGIRWQKMTCGTFAGLGAALLCSVVKFVSDPTRQVFEFTQ